jgi:N-acetylmuramoyl-L-alanine amidase
LSGIAWQVTARRAASGLFWLLPVILVSPGPAAAEPGTPITVLTAGGRRDVAAVVRGDAELVPLADLVAGLGIVVTSDARAGAVTLQKGSHELVFHHQKTLASVDGDLRLLPSASLLEGGRWLVPIEALPRLLGPLLDLPVEWRAAQRVLVVGKLSVPRVIVTTYLSGDLVRVVFDASENVPFQVQQETQRVSVAIPRDLLDVSLQPARLVGGIVDSVQYLGGKENLFSVELGARFRSLKASEQESPRRLVLELRGPAAVAGERPGATPPPGAAAGTPARTPVAQQPAEPGVRTIVIDPGHGGQEVGARGPGGTLEKDVSLAVARRLKAELVNARGLTVVLTRDKDGEVSLDERTAIANNYKADLFVSVHANASRARGARGSEVYFLSYQASDDESRRMAQAEGAAEPLARAAGTSDLALILWDMAQAEHLEESSQLASRLQEELAVVTGSEGRGVKQAPFRVLVGAGMPAVLVEIAFISNPDEEQQLASEAYQAKVAAALARGIERYRRERQGLAAATENPRGPR